MPRGLSDPTGETWVADLSARLLAGGARVSWGVPAHAPPPRGPRAVLVYPFASLSEEIDRIGPHGDHVLHNADAPRPQADRLDHLFGAFRLGPGDVCVLPEARLADLEAMFPLYATRDAAAAPVTLLRLTSLVGPSEGATLRTEEVEERLRWAAWRLAALGLPGKRVLLWPGNALLARLARAAGLETLEPLPVAAPAPPPHRILVALRSLGDGGAASIERIALLAGAPVDLVLGEPEARGGAIPAAAHAGGRYAAALCDRAMIACVARTTVEVPAEATIVLGTGADGLALEAETTLAAAEARLVDVIADAPDPPPPPDLAAALEGAVADATAQPFAAPPVVVHVAPAWASAGSSHVFSTQLDWLAERGMPTICLHVDTDDREANTPPEDAQAAIARRLAVLPGDRALCRWFLSRPRAQVALERAARLTAPYSPLSLEGEERLARQVALPDSLLRFLRHRPVAFVLLNYGHNWPVVERLGLSEAKVLLETHDVRPVQHALYNEAPLIEAAVDVELDMFARAGGVVFINDEERARFSQRHAAVPAVAAFPYRDGAVPTAPGPFETRASGLFAAGRIPPALLRDLVAPRTARRQRIALFVGSDHKANVMSLEWLFGRAYQHGLLDPRLTVLVAGNIAEAFRGVELPNLVFTGPVPDLEPFYDCADLVLLPVRAGTGLPIKTLDALAHGVPFVATRHATQAIPGLTERVGDHADPAAFARRVLQLAFEPGAAEAMRRDLEAWRQEAAGWSAYAAVWDGLATRVGVAPPPQPLHPPPARRRARQPSRPATLGSGRWRFDEALGVEDATGLRPLGGGAWALHGGYARLALALDTLGIEAAGAELLLTIAPASAGHVAVAVDGVPQAWLALEADRPLELRLVLPIARGATARHAVVEFRATTPGGEADAIASIEMVVARPLPRLPAATGTA